MITTTSNPPSFRLRSRSGAHPRASASTSFAAASSDTEDKMIAERASFCLGSVGWAVAGIRLYASTAKVWNIPATDISEFPGGMTPLGVVLMCHLRPRRSRRVCTHCGISLFLARTGSRCTNQISLQFSSIISAPLLLDSCYNSMHGFGSSWDEAARQLGSCGHRAILARLPVACAPAVNCAKNFSSDSLDE